MLRVGVTTPDAFCADGIVVTRTNIPMILTLLSDAINAYLW
jgi:hypothetical protein